LATLSKFQSIWEYEVQYIFRSRFIEAYDSHGSWEKLFKQCKGYIKTELLQDIDRPNRFITIDYWQSQSTFSAMKKTIDEEYNKLDKQCDAYTISENHIGFFSSE
jgi:heme-degrading monooxygenase HmoA